MLSSNVDSGYVIDGILVNQEKETMHDLNLIIVIVSVIIFVVNYAVYYQGPPITPESNMLSILIITIGTIDMLSDFLTGK